MKFVREIGALAWTLAGTGLVLITLSGNTKQMGIVISLAGLGVHLISVALNKENKE